WLPLTRRTLRAELEPATRLMTSETQGPAQLTRHLARKMRVSPVRLFFVVTVQPPFSRRAETAGERVSTRAPFSAAPTAFSVTRRASSTQQSEYSKPRVYWSRIGVPSGSRERSSVRVPGSFLRPPR